MGNASKALHSEERRHRYLKVVMQKHFSCLLIFTCLCLQLFCMIKWNSLIFRMKTYIFIHVLYFTLMKTLAEKDVSKCESKVELRAVLLPCPAKDSGCDDDDPLSQAMAAEEAQIFQANPKKVRMMKEDKEKGFPNAVKDCKRKLVITLKVKNSGKIVDCRLFLARRSTLYIIDLRLPKVPCDDEYIVVDHVFDPVTGGRGRLIAPVVLKLHQEQMIQLYGLQFQRVVNSDPFEEEKEADEACSANPENTTCGIATYDGKPIPFSEGFCCSCDPELNSKRQSSAAALDSDSFSYRDSKSTSRRSDRDGSLTAAIANPNLVKLKNGEKTSKEPNQTEDEKESKCPIKGLSPDKIPNYLIEHDHKIICGKENFLSELCKLREEKMKEEAAGSGAAGGRRITGDKKIRSDERNFIARSNGRLVKNREKSVEDLRRSKSDFGGAVAAAATTTTANSNVGGGGFEDKIGANADNLNDVASPKTINGPEIPETGDGSDRFVRGKRENLQAPVPSKPGKKSTLDEKLDEYANSRNLLKPNRRKRLLDLSHSRSRKASQARNKVCCGDSEDWKTVLGIDYPRDDRIRNPPPKYFFAHDKFIVHPNESTRMILNSTCKSSDDIDYEDSSADEREKCAKSSENGRKSGKEQEKSKNCLMKNKDKAKRPEVIVGEKISNKKKEKLRGKPDGAVFKGSPDTGSGESEGTKDAVENGKKFQGSGAKEKTEESKGSRPCQSEMSKEGSDEKMQNEMEKASNDNDEDSSRGLEKCKKFNRLNVKNVKNFLLRSDEEKSVPKQKMKNFHVPKNRERQKLFSRIMKNQDNVNSETEEGLRRGKLEKYSSREGKERKEVDESFPDEKKMDETEFSKGVKEQEEEEEERSDCLNSVPGENEAKSGEENSVASKESCDDESGKNIVQNLNEFVKPEFDKAESSPQGKLMEEQRKIFNYLWGMQIDEKPGRPYFPIFNMKPESRNVDFKFEIIRKPFRSEPANIKEFLKARMQEAPTSSRLEVNGYPRSDADFGRKGPPLRLRQYHPAVLYGTPQTSFVAGNRKGGSVPAARSRKRHYYFKTSELADRQEPANDKKGKLARRKYDAHPVVRKPYAPLLDCDAYKRRLARAQRARQNLLASLRKREELLGSDENGGNPDESNGEGIRIKRTPGDDFESAKRFFKSDLVGPNYSGSEPNGIPADDAKVEGGKSDGDQANGSGDDDSVSKPGNFPGNRSAGQRNAKVASDTERLLRSYANAPDYVREKAKAGPKGKRQAFEDASRIPSNCEKDAYEYTQDTAHCMRFGDLWYSAYAIKKPIVAQIVGVRLFDRCGSTGAEGTSRWRDLTRGKTIRIGTFLPKAEDDFPTISMTFIGGKTKKAPSAIDTDNYLLLVPSHVSDPSKAGYYPQFDGGPNEYLVVESKDVSSGGDCNMIGTSFEAFARQPDRCSRPRGSCLKRQPVDLWREDMEARIRGKRGKYFVENYGTVSNSPVKTYTNFTGEFLALEYYEEYTSTIEIEVKADFNAMVRKGSIAQIPAVYIDGTYPKKTRIILSVLNIGLTSSYFRPRLGDCPPDLDPAWCPLEGPLVTISPQQRHDFKLDLSGALPPNKIHVTVEVLNEVNKKLAYRKIVIKKGDRCICAFHCKCNCVGNVDGRVCHQIKEDEYRGAGYLGPFPFRGGSTSSASESLRKNVRVIFATAANVLLLMGVIKGILGVFLRRLGIAGTRIVVGPRRISHYYERELENCSVLFDECGFPVHPTTCLPVQMVPLWIEILINFAFFFLYPLRGIWYLLGLLPCCTIVIEMCDESSQQEEGTSDNEKSSSPLLSKTPPQPTNLTYNMTSLNSKKGKAGEYLPYLPYKGDDDPLEEDDTEFVLQEMKRYRKKVSLI